MKKVLVLITVCLLSFTMFLPIYALAENSDECQHIWIPNSDENGQHCETCGKDYCEVMGHTEGTAATCTKLSICSICKKEYGELLDHIYTKTDDCSAKIICDRCGEVIKASGNHDWQKATCTSPKTCKTCGTVEGGILIHRWSEGIITKIPTETTTGSIRFVCEDCGLINNQAIYATNSTEESDIGKFIIPTIIGIIVVLLICAIIVYVLMIKKKKNR